MADLPTNIKAIQWNNRIKSVTLMMVFLVGILIFATSFVLMIAAPIGLLVVVFAPPDPTFNLADIMHQPRLYSHILKYFLKIFLFSLGATLMFIYKGVSNIGRIFDARPLKLHSSDPFYRELETQCIERGLSIPELFIFNQRALSSQVTAAIIQGVRRKSALIVSDASFKLKAPVRQALLAQAVQRLYTKDTYFLTLFCFLGYFPFHVSRSLRKWVGWIFRPALWIADQVMAPFRPLMLDIRLARLDVGSLELTKDAGPMHELLEKLCSYIELKKYFHTPYLSLFVAQSTGSYRKDILNS